MATQAEFNQFVMNKLEQIDLKLKELEAKNLLALTLAEQAMEMAAFHSGITPILDESLKTKLNLMKQRHEGQRNRAQQVVAMFTPGAEGNA